MPIKQIKIVEASFSWVLKNLGCGLWFLRTGQCLKVKEFSAEFITVAKLNKFLIFLEKTNIFSKMNEFTEGRFPYFNFSFIE